MVVVRGRHGRLFHVFAADPSGENGGLSGESSVVLTEKIANGASEAMQDDCTANTAASAAAAAAAAAVSTGTVDPEPLSLLPVQAPANSTTVEINGNGNGTSSSLSIVGGDNLNEPAAKRASANAPMDDASQVMVAPMPVPSAPPALVDVPNVNDDGGSGGASGGNGIETFMHRLRNVWSAMSLRDSNKRARGGGSTARPLTMEEWMDLNLSSHLAFPLKAWSSNALNMSFQFLNIRTLQSQCEDSFKAVYATASNKERMDAISCPWLMSDRIPMPPPTQRGYQMRRTRDFMCPSLFLTGFTSPPFKLMRSEFEANYLKPDSDKPASSAFPSIALRPRETVGDKDFVLPEAERVLASIDQFAQQHLAAIIAYHNEIVLRPDAADIVGNPEKCAEHNFTTSVWGLNLVSLAKFNSIMRYNEQNLYPPNAHFFCTWQPARIRHSLMKKKQMLAPYRVACVNLDYHARLASAVAEADGATPWSPEMDATQRGQRIRKMKMYLPMSDQALERTLETLVGEDAAAFSKDQLKTQQDMFVENILDVAVAEESDEGDVITFTYPKDAPQINRSRQPETNFLLGVERADPTTGETRVETHRVLPVHRGDGTDEFVRDMVTGGIVWRFIGPEDIPMFAKINVVAKLSQIWAVAEKVERSTDMPSTSVVVPVSHSSGTDPRAAGSSSSSSVVLGEKTVRAGVKILAQEIRITPDLERERKRREDQEANGGYLEGGMNAADQSGGDPVNTSGALFGNTSFFTELAPEQVDTEFDPEKAQAALQTLIASRENDDTLMQEREARRQQENAQGGGGDSDAATLGSNSAAAAAAGGAGGDSNRGGWTNTSAFGGSGSSVNGMPPPAGKFLSGVNPPM